MLNDHIDHPHDSLSHVAAPSPVCVSGDIPFSENVRLSSWFATGMGFGMTSATSTTMCGHARTDAVNGGWLRTPKFGTYHHSQRWRSAA